MQIANTRFVQRIDTLRDAICPGSSTSAEGPFTGNQGGRFYDVLLTYPTAALFATPRNAPSGGRIGGERRLGSRPLDGRGQPCCRTRIGERMAPSEPKRGRSYGGRGAEAPLAQDSAMVVGGTPAGATKPARLSRSIASCAATTSSMKSADVNG